MASRLMTAMRAAKAATRFGNTVEATRLIQGALSRGSKSSVPAWAQTLSPAASLLAPETEVERDAAAERMTADTVTARTFSCEAGTRDYKLYVPPGEVRGLVLMLHGCTQNPDDFAAGTRMNSVAENHGLAVAYPAQTRLHNGSACWNWFQKEHQVRDAGEPAILAGIARALTKEFSLSREQVFVAGLSAGGAMAVIMTEIYPDIFSAAGVHSGLPYQCASSVMTALTAMRGPVGRRAGEVSKGHHATTKVRTIIFHGTQDKTVNSSNANDIARNAASKWNHDFLPPEVGVTNGRAYSRTIIRDADGNIIVENWSIEGIGHAWSGGSRLGSFTEPSGPIASAEMVRFFLGNPST